MKKAILYCRVSTKRQLNSGLSLKSQEADGKKWALKNGYEITKVVIDQASGSKSAMNELLNKTIDLCITSHKTLIIAKFDRLGRDYNFLTNITNTNGLDIVCCDFNIKDRTTLLVLAMLAEYELLQSKDRRSKAIAQKRLEGRKMGSIDNMKKATPESRKRGGENSGQKARERAFLKAKPYVNSYIEYFIDNDYNHSIAGFRRYLMDTGAKTVRGSSNWQLTTVKRLYNQIEKHLKIAKLKDEKRYKKFTHINESRYSKNGNTNLRFVNLILENNQT